MKLINIGFGNLVSAGRVVAVVSPDSAPVKRLVKEARERGMLIDASYGRSTRAHHGFRPCRPFGFAAGNGGRPCRRAAGGQSDRRGAVKSWKMKNICL